MSSSDTKDIRVAAKNGCCLAEQVLQTLKALIDCYKDGLGLEKSYLLTTVKDDILLEIQLALSGSSHPLGLTYLFKERYFQDKVRVRIGCDSAPKIMVSLSTQQAACTAWHVDMMPEGTPRASSQCILLAKHDQVAIAPGQNTSGCNQAAEGGA